MSEKSLQFIGHVCTSCVVAGLVALAVITAGTMLWVAYLN